MLRYTVFAVIFSLHSCFGIEDIIRTSPLYSLTTFPELITSSSPLSTTTNSLNCQSISRQYDPQSKVESSISTSSSTISTTTSQTTTLQTSSSATMAILKTTLTSNSSSTTLSLNELTSSVLQQLFDPLTLHCNISTPFPSGLKMQQYAQCSSQKTAISHPVIGFVLTNTTAMIIFVLDVELLVQCVNAMRHIDNAQSY
uniref:Uncharacterized protein n=1 Tax=Ditylenchus dipsaci TaxID=166011 RepID=A0A915DQP2_9BILA